MQDLIPGLRLAELLAARLCHELVSPVGAIANGVEILEDEPGFARDAARLIEQSAREARLRLQFYRIAYGSVGDVAVELARKAADAFFADGKIACDWPETLDFPPGAAKLACNLLLVAAEALPRGGRVALAAGDPRRLLSVVAEGGDARLHDRVAELLTLPSAVDSLTPRQAQPVFTAALAWRLGARIETVRHSPEMIEFAVNR